MCATWSTKQIIGIKKMDKVINTIELINEIPLSTTKKKGSNSACIDNGPTVEVFRKIIE